MKKLSLAEKSGIRTQQVACLVNGKHTEFMCSVYADRIVYVVTQFMKPGTVVEACKDSEGGGTTTYSITTLMGKRDDLCINLLARQLAEWFGRRTQKELLLCIGLEPIPEDEIDLLHSTLDALMDCCLAIAAW